MSVLLPPPQRTTDWIQTFTCNKYWPLEPRAEDVRLEDIAHALSMMCRFAGHCRRFYSVAEHCVHVSEILEPKSPQVALWGLFHDASEAYLVDIPRPVKIAKDFSFYRGAESANMMAICERFGLDPVEPPAVKIADNIMLATEAKALFEHAVDGWTDILPAPIIMEYPLGWSPELAKKNFLKRYEQLMSLQSK